MKKRILLFLLFSFSAIFTQSLYQQVASYAATLNEQLLPDNKNLSAPDYNAFFGNQRTKYFLYRATSLFLSSQTTFLNKQQFETLLQKSSANTRQQQRSSSIIPIISTQDSRFIVFGNLQGAFHSLVRCIGELIRKKILDENLTIIQPNTSLVFLGNALGRSAYPLETFTLILALINANPHNIFYLRGTEESKHRWTLNNLACELSVYYSGKEKDNIENKIQSFFDTLPPALLAGIEKRPPYTCFAPGMFSSDLENQLQAQQIQCDLFTINAKICGVSDEFVYRKNEGWYVGIPTHGITTWNIACPPTPTYQKLFGNYFDIFSTISFEKDIDQSSISFFNRDVHTNNRFANAGTYCLTTEQKITPNTSVCSTEKPFIIGSTLPLAMGLAQQSMHLIVGMSMRINEQNQLGGIKHRPIKMIYLNDDYNPKLAQENIELLLTKYKTNITLGSNGSPTLASYLDRVKNNEVFVFFPTTCAPMFRDPSIKAIINFAPSYSQEGAALTEFAIKNQKASTIVIFYQNDTFGEGILKGAQDYFDTLKLTNASMHPIAYNRSDTNFSNQVQNIIGIKPDSIILASTESAASELIRQLGIDNLLNIAILGNSDMSSQNFNSYMKSIGIPFSYIQHIPATETSKNPFMVAFKNKRKLYGYPDDPFVFEGYMIAELFITAAQKVTGELTGAAIMKQLEEYSRQIGTFNLKFDPKTRTISKDFSIIANEETQQ